MLRWLPENVSTYGQEIDALFGTIYWITLIAFLLVAVLMIVFMIKYRAREGRRATYIHGNTKLEILWTIVPAIILVFLGIVSVPVWRSVKADMPPHDIEVQVTAKQFNWDILYPGPDGKFGTDDDLQLDNQLHVEVNKVVRVNLKSNDVIHSFFLPNLRLKQDAVPGRTIPVWFEAIKPGRYELPCAELCGFGHSGMLGYLTVHTPEAYRAWLKEQWPTS